MIKFFRKIRQNMIKENKVSKYLLYAIGEIVLVVFGILIALQLNNWNELKKKNEKEKVFLREIISDLSYNENNSEVNIERILDMGRDSITKTFNYVINHLEKKLPYNHSLSRAFYILHQLPTLNIKSSGYESLKSSGMDIIQNDSLRSNIGEYYTASVKMKQNAFNELRDDFYNYILKFPRTLFITKKDKNLIKVQIPVNYEQLMENTEYIESLKMFSSIYIMDLNFTKWYLNETKVLKEELEAYLKEN